MRYKYFGDFYVEVPTNEGKGKLGEKLKSYNDNPELLMMAIPLMTRNAIVTLEFESDEELKPEMVLGLGINIISQTNSIVISGTVVRDSDKKYSIYRSELGDS